MPIANLSKLGFDQPTWEQLAFAPATGVAGSSITDDNERFVYAMFATSATAAQFWRYDTWHNSWQQLATPATQTITLGVLIFSPVFGAQVNGKCYGSIFSFQANGTTCYWYRYDIATNTWATALSVATVPAAFGTDCHICYPQVPLNNYEGAFHTNATKTITTGAVAAVGATAVTVAALPIALAAGTVLDFGQVNVTLTAAAAKGATSLAVSALSNGLAAGAVLRSPEGLDVVLSSAAAAAATTVAIYPLTKALASGAVCTIRKRAVLTAAAAAAAVSVTVSGLLVNLASAENAYYNDNAYLIGHNATQIYRYSFGANAWATTSANSGNPALPAITAAPGAGGRIFWLPGIYPDRLYILRGASSATLYYYDLQANTMNAVTANPATETFTTGTMTARRQLNGKAVSFLIEKDATLRLFEFKPIQSTLEPYGTEWLYPTGAAVVGDRMCCVTSPDGVEFLYLMAHSGTAWLRCALIDQ